MIPSVDTRLATMVSSMTGVIAPRLAGTDPFAEEQAALLVGHLQVLRGQQPIVDEFEQLEHNRTRALARELLDAVAGVEGPETAAAVEALRGLLEGPVPFTMAAVRDAQDRLTAAISELVRADGVDGTEETVAATTRIVLAYEQPHSLRLRSYFSAMGYESGESVVPPLEAMMEDFRALFGGAGGTTDARP